MQKKAMFVLICSSVLMLWLSSHKVCFLGSFLFLKTRGGSFVCLFEFVFTTQPWLQQVPGTTVRSHPRSFSVEARSLVSPKCSLISTFTPLAVFCVREIYVCMSWFVWDGFFSQFFFFFYFQIKIFLHVNTFAHNVQYIMIYMSSM